MYIHSNLCSDDLQGSIAAIQSSIEEAQVVFVYIVFICKV